MRIVEDFEAKLFGERGPKDDDKGRDWYVLIKARAQVVARELTSGIGGFLYSMPCSRMVHHLRRGKGERNLVIYVVMI